MSASPLTPDEIRASAEVHRELGPEYDQAVVGAFLDRVGQEIDARVDARLAEASRAQQPAEQPGAKGSFALAICSMAFGIPITAILLNGRNSVGIGGVFIVWLAIAIINVAYTRRPRTPGSGR
jgi:hypothetical protein